MAIRIPGLAALASLKRFGSVNITDFRSRIPGLAALASLKRIHHVWPDFSRSGIPGLAALASLKPFAMDSLSTGKRGFRGLLPWPH